MGRGEKKRKLDQKNNLILCLVLKKYEGTKKKLLRKLISHISLLYKKRKINIIKINDKFLYF